MNKMTTDAWILLKKEILYLISLSENCPMFTLCVYEGIYAFMKIEFILIKIFGILLLAIGLFSLFCVPAELTSFYAFIEGGNYHYEGFGFGSLMFAFIIFSTMVYFSFAFLGIPLGIGNIELRKWGYNLSIAVLRVVMILGAALSVSFLFSFKLIRTLELYQTLIILIFFLLFLIILPHFLIKFYKSPKTERLFKASTMESYFERQSVDKLTIILLNLFWVVIFYLLLFLKGAFPLLGKFVFKREGTYLLSIVIFILLVLTYLFYKNKQYAKYGIILCYILLFPTFAFTFFHIPTNDFLNMLNLPFYELRRIVPFFRIPAGVNLGFFFGILIIIQIYVVFRLIRMENDNI